MADNTNPNEGQSQPTTGRGASSYLTRTLEELGLVSLYHSSFDVKLLCIQRFFRLFAYGASTLVLVAFMEALGFSKTRIGLFMTLTIGGDVCISFILTIFADFLGRKAILMLGATLMCGSGVIFAFFGNYWVLLAAAIFGVISPSGNEIGPFRAVEESVVAHLTTPSTRADIFAWYTLLGSAGTAFGYMTCGWTMQGLTEGLNWQLLDAYRAVFLGYAGLGAVKFVLALSLSGKVESDKKQAAKRAATGRDQETTPLLREDNVDNGSGSGNGVGDGNGSNIASAEPPKRTGIYAALPEISKETRVIVFNLCLLFGLDAFASGLSTFSWITYFFRWKHHVDDGTLGSIFFTSSIISAASILVASSLAKRFGNVNTMVFTHLPSDIFLTLIPIPNNVALALVFLFLRDCTKSMDAAPRSAFMAAILLPEERTAIMGLINVVKATAQSIGPSITGVLVDKGLFWVTFLCAGSGKIIYDLGLLAVFKNHEREKAARAA